MNNKNNSKSKSFLSENQVNTRIHRRGKLIHAELNRAQLITGPRRNRPTRILSDKTETADRHYKLCRFKAVKPPTQAVCSHHKVTTVACRHCFSTTSPKPAPVKAITTPPAMAYGLRNCLHVHPKTTNWLWPVMQYLPFLTFCWNRRMFQYSSCDKATVLTRTIVQEALLHTAKQDFRADKATDISDLLVNNSRKAIDTLTGMAARVSNMVLHIAGISLFYVLKIFLKSIQIDRGQLDTLRRTVSGNQPTIFLPTHRSHLDYVLIPFILWCNDIKVPLIAAGDNLNLPVLGRILQWLGAFFIRRSLDNGHTKKDYVYRALLHSYVQNVLELNNNLLFFIEGGRSRCGKPLRPKSGLLSVLVDLYESGHAADCLLVPMALSYEKVPEAPFLAEQLGRPKEPESLRSALQGVWNVLRSYQGSVRVDFSPAFSLGQYIAVARGPLYSHYRGRRTTSSSSLVSLLGNATTDADDRDKYRRLIRGLAEHSIHTASNSAALMTTQLVAFLLVTRWREGVSLANACDQLDWLRRKVADRNGKLGFTGKSGDIINYALRLLEGTTLCGTGKKGRTRKKDGTRKNISGVTGTRNVNNNDAELIPNMSPRALIALSYYGNSLTPLFALEAVVAVSFCVEADIVPAVPMSLYHHRCPSASRQLLLSRCGFLYNALSYEIPMGPPCEQRDVSLMEALSRLGLEGSLTVESHKEPMSAAEQLRVERPDDSESEHSEEGRDNTYRDHRVVLNLDEVGAIDYIDFLHKVIGPYIEGYTVSARYIAKQVETGAPVGFNDLLGDIRRVARQRVDNNAAHWPESCFNSTVTNSLNFFIREGFLETYKNVDDIQLVCVKPPQGGQSESPIQQFAYLIEEYNF